MSHTILFVPGFWEGPVAFDPVVSILKSKGFVTRSASLPSTGTVSPGNPKMTDDIKAIRSIVSELAEEGNVITLVLHSAGAFLGSNAFEGLTIPARQKQCLKGGVKSIVFLTGAIFPEGFEHQPLPFSTCDVSPCFRDILFAPLQGMIRVDSCPREVQCIV